MATWPYRRRAPEGSHPRLRLVVPEARQGPGDLPAGAVSRLDLVVARRAGGVLPGEHRTAGVGVGTELAQLRPYEPGDDARQLDPAASARTGIPHVRQQVPERAMTTWLVLDVSSGMAFGTGRRLKSDVTEGVATVTAQIAVRRGGRIAVVTAGAPETHLLPPRGGRGAMAQVRRLVAEGVAPDGGRGTPLSEALGRVRKLATQPGLVVIASDLRDEGWERPLRALSQRHSVIVCEIVDPREAELPDVGQMVFVDPETGAQVEAHTSSPKLREAFAAAEAERRDSVSAALRRAGADHVVLSTDGDWLRELARRLR
jgi:uncharacterized protein (DUF58 family)